MDTLCFVVVFLAAVHQASADCCCFPNQLQGIQSLSTKQDTNKSCTTVTGLYQISFDLMKEEVYLEGTVYIKGKPLKQQVLQSYATGKTYYVANGRCIVVPLKKRLLRCVPSNAKPMLSTYSGIEKDVFGVDMYYFKEDRVQTTLTVMRRGCVPIAEHLESCDAVTDVNYYGLSLGIRNATQFDIPKACKKATEMSKIPEEINRCISKVQWQIKDIDNLVWYEFFAQDMHGYDVVYPLPRAVTLNNLCNLDLIYCDKLHTNFQRLPFAVLKVAITL